MFLQNYHYSHTENILYVESITDVVIEICKEKSENTEINMITIMKFLVLETFKKNVSTVCLFS
ncbi:unnamed protein product [Heterobilharzia americana]|nr:unnamed protein product [Heterobilharzia americana]